MTYLDKIREKRLESSNKLAQQEAQEHQTNVADKNGTLVAATIKAENLRSRGNTQNVNVTNQDLAKTGDIKELGGHIEKLGETLKPESIDWQPVRESLSELAEQLKELPRTFPEIPKPVDSVTVKNQIDIEPTLKSIQNAIENLKLAPVFDPKIEVKAAKPADVVVDTQPLADILEAHHAKKKKQAPLLLDNYKAQDIDNDAGSMQYVGFLNPDGAWYIVENDIEGNSLRYRFGASGYKAAWRSHVSKSYKLLNEAIDEIRT